MAPPEVNTSQTPDAELLAASRRGEHAAFGELVARYQSLVAAVSYAATCDRTLGDDVTQETFLVAWRQLDQLRDPDRLSAWLCAIARNLARKAQRKRAREVPLSQEDTASDITPFDDLSAAETERVVNAALARVPETCRDAMVLYYREQLPAKDVAAALGISEAATMQRLSRGRQQLATVIAQVEQTLRDHPRRNVVASVLAALPLLGASQAQASDLRPHRSSLTMALVIVAGLIVVGATIAGLRDDWGGLATRERAEAAERPVPGSVGRERAKGVTLEPVAGRGGPRARLAGRVIFDGRPVAGAMVSIVSADLSAPPTTITTGDDGRFDYGTVAATAVVIGASAPDKAADLLEVDLGKPGLRRPDDLVLELYACEADLHGFVLDAGGGPIPAAVLRRGPIEITSAVDGGYSLCLPAGAVNVEVGAEGYGTIRVSSRVTNRVRRDFRLSPGGVVTGRIVRASDGSSVANAVVTLPSLQRSLANTFAAEARALTDGEGRFRVEGLVPGRRSLAARADGLRAQETEVNVTVGESGRELTVMLEPTTLVRGRVVDENGAPMNGIGVALIDRERFGDQLALRAVSGEEGAFLIEGVLPGAYRVETEPQVTAEPVRVEVPVAGVVDLEVVVPRGSTISGIVLHDGEPVGGASISAQIVSGREPRWVSGRTDSEGRFRIAQVPPGEHELVASCSRLGASSRSVTVTAVKGRDVSGVTFKLTIAGSVAGAVIDQRGTPVSGAYVMFSAVNGFGYGESTTAEDGTFRASGMAVGDYTVAVRASPAASTSLLPTRGDAHPVVHIADAHARVEGMRYEVIVDRMTISGTVVDDRGVPAGDVHVQAVAQGDWSWGSGDVPFDVTDVAGTFAVGELSAGDYHLTARGGDGAVAYAKVSAGARDVTIVLPTPGGIDGTLVGFPTTPQVLARSNERGRNFELPGALKATTVGTTFGLRGVAPGRYWIVGMSGGVVGDAQEVDVRAGENARVTLTYRGTGSIHAKVVDSGGNPIPDAICEYSHETGPYDDVTADDRGEVSIAVASVGKTFVECRHRSDRKVRGEANAVVVAGQTTSVSVVLAGEDESRPRGTIGATFENVSGALRIKSVVEGGPAAVAGIRPRDIVLELVLEGQEDFQIPINALTDTVFERFVSGLPPGRKLALKVRRGTATFDAKVTVAAP